MDQDQISNLTTTEPMPILDELTKIFSEFWQSEWKILIVLIAAPLLLIFIRIVSPILVKALLSITDNQAGNLATQKRVKTLANVIEATSLVLILITVVWVFFSELNISMTPIITGAGILSLAVGFGAQSLVKDVISGVFIIMENQFNQGDWIKVGDFEGKVTEINLRRTVLQTAKGARHIIPNGEIQAVTNYTNKYSVVSIDIPLKLDENFDQVNKIINQAGKQLVKDKNFKDFILDTPESVGINEIKDNAAIVRVWGKVKPGKKLAVKRALNAKIFKAFKEEGIKLPTRVLR